MDEAEVLRVDGELRVRLPKGVTAQDFTDWLNRLPNRKELELVKSPEEWSSAEIPKEWR